MSVIRFEITDARAELTRLIRATEAGGPAPTQREERYRAGRLQGLREALETVDMYIRCEESGRAVRLRPSGEVIQEVETRASA